LSLFYRRLVLREEEKNLEVPSQHFTECLCFHLLSQLHQVCKKQWWPAVLKIVATYNEVTLFFHCEQDGDGGDGGYAG
jgi:hypothetical protein